MFIPRSLSRHYARAHANHRRIAVGAATVAILVAVAKLVVAAKELVIAWRYGVSGVVDAYQIAFTITTWLPLVVTSIATSVLVPTLIASDENPVQQARFLAELNGAMLGLAALLAVVTLAAGPAIGEWMTGELAETTRDLSRAMVLQLAPLALFMTLAGYFAARLQARERFAYTLLEAAPSAGIILFVLFAPLAWGAAPLIWGVLIGGAVQAIWLAVMVRRSDNGLGGLAWSRASPQWRRLFQALAIMAIGQTIIMLSQPVDQIFAAGLEDGAVAVLGYANRLIGLATGLGTIALARALLPVLSSVAANRQFELGRAQALRWSGVMFAVGALAALVGWIITPWAVSFLFERGAFSAQDSKAVARVVQFGLPQLPLFFGGIVLVQWFSAIRRYDVILSATIIGILAKLTFNFLLVPTFGVTGIMIGTCAMYAGTFILLALRLTK